MSTEHSRIAAFQLEHTESFDDAMSEVHRCLKWSDDHSVNIACFPECYLGGYFPNDRERSASVALDLSGKRFNELVESFAGHRTAFVVGLTERRGLELRNTAVVISAGEMVGSYTKAHPNEAFFEAGDAYPVFSLHGATVGVNICNDANYPEAASAVAELGAQVILMPLNNRMRRPNADAWRPRHLENLKARAAETGRWVVSADIVARGENLVSYGCTAIVGPDGLVAGRAAEERVGYAMHDVPLTDR